MIDAIPRVSIITIAYNSRGDIEETLHSVFLQTYTNIEYIIVDGGSTDGTMDIVNRFRDRIDHVVSEKDDGIYDAFNKGVALANGQWVFFLNAGDRFYDSHVLTDVFSVSYQESLGVLVGDVQYEDGRVFHSSVSKAILIKNGIHHQGAFYRLSQLHRFPFNKSYRVLGDYDVNLKLFFAGVSMRHLPQLISLCRLGGVSVVLKGDKYLEEIRLKKALFKRWYLYPLIYMPLVKYVTKCILKTLRPTVPQGMRVGS